MWTNTFLFLPYLAIGWRLVTSGVENRRGVRAIRAYVVSLGSQSVTLLLVFSTRSRLEVFDRPVGKTAASIPRGATQTLGYVKDLKLVWFGDFKIHFGSRILAYRAACLAGLL